MKNDALYDYVKSQLEKGVSADDLFDVMSMAEDDFNAEKEKKEKEEAQKKVKEELKKRAGDDFYNAYVKYFNTVYPSNELPKDAKKLFKAELDFIDYLMTGKVKDYDETLAKFFKQFF
jgi:hypothetical protein